jgi:hypothetical protein
MLVLSKTLFASMLPEEITSQINLAYCHILVLGVCVTYKTGFGFDDRICWTFILVVRYLNIRLVVFVRIAILQLIYSLRGKTR